MKSPVMAVCTSGSLNMSPVGVFWVRSSGATISGLGSAVKCGFRESADSIASLDSGGVMRVISVCFFSCMSMTILVERKGKKGSQGETYLRFPCDYTIPRDTRP
jgi:hypothetical protein